MATELGLLSATQLQKLSNQSQKKKPKPEAAAAWMLNPKQPPQKDDDSWEIRAFAEDTSNIMGTTWPPRSYTCTFCRREFRSAQALGGHMNVHRRDRARLSQTQPPTAGSSSSTSSSTLIIPTQEFATNGGYCLLYQLLNPNDVFTPTTITSCAVNFPSTLLSISPYPQNSLIRPSADFPLDPTTTFPSASTSNSNESAIAEPDLELRLGHRPTPNQQVIIYSERV